MFPGLLYTFRAVGKTTLRARNKKYSMSREEGHDPHSAKGIPRARIDGAGESAANSGKLCCYLGQKV
jgi:hypothetical protein